MDYEASIVLSSFPEAVYGSCFIHNPTHLSVCAMDGASRFLEILRRLRFLGCECQPVSPQVPLYPIEAIGNLNLDKEAWFPNMSAVALFQGVPEHLPEVNAAYAAFSGFLTQTGNYRSPLAPGDLQEWFAASSAVELIAWSELVVRFRPKKLGSFLLSPHWAC